MNKQIYYENQVLPHQLSDNETTFNDLMDDKELLKRLQKAITTKETIYTYCESSDVKNGITELSFIENSNIIGYILLNDITYDKVHIGKANSCVGYNIGVKIVQIEEENNGFIRVRCSRSEVLKEIHDMYNSDIEKEILKEGQMIKGIVTGMDFNKVYIDIGGDVTAILGVADISRVFVRDPSEVIQVGQVLELAVKKVYPIDGDKPMHISLSRAMLQNGWENIDRRLKVGKIVPGIVKNRMATGIFIELSESFEGIAEDIPVGVKYNYGDRVLVNILTIDKKRHKIKLRIIQNR